MSRHCSREHVVTIAENEALDIIREEQCSPAISSVKIDATSKMKTLEKSRTCDCHCKNETESVKTKINTEEIKSILKEKEIAMRQEFEQHLASEITKLKKKFDFILQNEEVRASHMLQEAHRERQEKITALQAQLECKNLAEYSGYIRALQNILTDGQSLILQLSRGYKTAARVDQEWREKMKSVINEFQAYIQNFCGGTPDTSQYLLDLPALLETKTSIYDDPKEDPIEHEEEETPLHHTESDTNKAWFDMLDDECRPFVVFGDMGDFKPQQRRKVLGTVKAAKTAPEYWKQYVFNEMFLKSDCSNADSIKDEYPKRLPSKTDRQSEDKDDEEEEPASLHGSIHDSLRIVPRGPDKDSRINYEKVCPVDKCKRMQVDSFMRSLPPYMRANPFIHFEQTYDDYETCSPEQLEILMKRIEEKRKKEKTALPIFESDPLKDWYPEVQGVGVQTSEESLPPCTCIVPSPTPVSSVGMIFNMADLIPVKQNLDTIRAHCFYDDDIEFDRFKVLGEVTNENFKQDSSENFTKRRLSGIKRILKKHPSLCELFQANTQCC
ncbi:unnamed protein product [Diatraea saccharalis]|uniref:Uncharacterized protein n=1 Tax=Diatraea saccharalis TaxID=40085 RepID=A0A9N9WKN6_9NEOP|nr:unnamed protein product [Diatraea saccharalis]